MLIIPQSTEKSTPSAKKVEEGLSKDSRGSLDTDYLSAVENGDEKTQERIIVEAAKKSGYTERAYHGTTAQITSFKLFFNNLLTKQQNRSKISLS